MEFSHFDNNGNIQMVDISNKDITNRIAIASGKIKMSELCYKMVTNKKIKKGDVFTISKIAGIMAAKKCHELIPLCHQINLNKVDIHFELYDDTNEIKVISYVSTDAKTGVEMEALTSVNIALLTIYDMCKAVDKKMVINSVKLLEKNGGKSGHFINESSINER